jgi:L-amino acid N-acyltransferase YncA
VRGLGLSREGDAPLDVRVSVGFILTMIRIATPDDAGQIAEIYAPYVTETVISFEETPPDAEAFARRMAAGLETYPWLVAETDGVIEGYAYAGRFSERAAYRWSVESSVYVRRGCERRGLGSALYARLFEILKAQGFHSVFGGATLPNPASVGLHERCGFTPVGVYKEVGYKQGAWRDVGWQRLDLGAPGGGGAPPPEPIPFSALRERGEAARVLERLDRGDSTGK